MASQRLSGPAGPASVSSRVEIDGVHFDPVTEHQAVAHVMSELTHRRGGMLLTPNVDILRQLRKPHLAELKHAADLVVADGMPIVWAARLKGEPLPERVTGASLVPALSAAAAAAERSVYLLGGDEGVAERGAMTLRRDLPGSRVVGWHCPPFGFERDEQEMRTIVEDLERTRPDLVFVGLGFPKQEKLIAVLRRRLPETWFVGCGGALTFLSGQISRAPEAMQRSGLEWVHRLAMEPRRMARRYLVDDMPYAIGMFARTARRPGVLRRSAA